ncbi:hypothetical protein GKJPGBOP_00213 [Streptomyces paromomycinus]|uniref:Uncharacterized protein n=1 Tax=Streptomyces paromomycinus TaxID=92743 RepID=A0A401VTZ5_STREY|nr:hypothetical protein GKJPGBOP_00213 [Streptomyces paromomycinus]
MIVDTVAVDGAGSQATGIPLETATADRRRRTGTSRRPA